MRRALGLAVLLLALALLGFAARVAVFGADAPLPSGEAAAEGEVLSGEVVPSPAGEPFLYGRLRLSPSGEGSGGSFTHADRVHGSPRVRVRTASGERALVLPDPGEWHVLDDHDDSVEVDSLEGVPLFTDEDVRTVARRMEPPYRVTVRAIRPGDRVIAEVRGETAVRLYVGERPALEAYRATREAQRWPAVALLALLGGATAVGAFALLRKKPATAE